MTGQRNVRPPAQVARPLEVSSLRLPDRVSVRRHHLVLPLPQLLSARRSGEQTSADPGLSGSLRVHPWWTSPSLPSARSGICSQLPRPDRSGLRCLALNVSACVDPALTPKPSECFRLFSSPPVAPSRPDICTYDDMRHD
ncbi:hypothetical protein BGZ61DRAFT_440985 [Ilyonectria robusta]|uniref:uncharacterized protein n=1 Tax=Ilyonectria robusta TaxID=1079257 RepID=UPI001E8DC200|nr:uncharacterized protein BGZ61DRAFT_440985 [Ilyonectria robusta]KAH8735818.1 hypothetical protein BGZ61DRAFT_440985 [Ilyonectria robusta]